MLGRGHGKGLERMGYGKEGQEGEEK